MNPTHSAKKELSPTYWRRRAQEVREAAKDVQVNKAILEEVAASYEEMADLMECRARPKTRSRYASEEIAKNENPVLLKGTALRSS